MIRLLPAALPSALAAALVTLSLASPTRADVAEAVDQVILPGYAAFRQTTAALSDQTGTTCDPAALRPAFDAAFDAWMQVQHLQLGPAEAEGRALAINFWPDPKGSGAKAQAELIDTKNPVATDPAAFAQLSVSARGFPALERLLFSAPPPEGYACTLVQATTADLARLAAEIDTGWQQGFAAQLTAPGPGGSYLSPAEARQALLTQLVIGVDRLGDDRLGRPLGTFHKPRPDRAEAIASGRSLRNVQQSLIGLRALAAALVPEAPQTMAAFDRAEKLATDLNDPVFAGVDDPSGRLKVEILQQALHAVRDAAMSEMAGKLGVALGFNAADGD